MNANNEKLKKRAYIPPQLVRVTLDSEISLVLESNPPTGPGESLGKAPEYFNNDPFKTNLG